MKDASGSDYSVSTMQAVNRIRRRTNEVVDRLLVSAWRKLPRAQSELDAASLDRVTAIAVSFNTLVLTKLMLLTLSEYLGGKLHRVVMVDNDSHDGSWEFLSKLSARTDQVTAVRNRLHRHHAGGLRRGISAINRLDSRLAPTERTNAYLIADSDIIFLRSDLIDMMRATMQEQKASLVGEIQYDVGEPYVHPSCCMMSRSAYADPRVWPFVHHGAPALKMQQSMREAGLSIANFPVRTGGYVVHRGRGSIEGIQSLDKWHPYATVEWSAHFHGNPNGAQIWRETEARYESLLTVQAETEAVDHIADCLGG